MYIFLTCPAFCPVTRLLGNTRLLAIININRMPVNQSPQKYFRLNIFFRLPEPVSRMIQVECEWFGIFFALDTQNDHQTTWSIELNLIRKMWFFSFFPRCSFLRRSCIIGAQLEVKVCTLGTVINRTAYPADYCQLEGSGRHSQPMPIRWMSWESVLLVSKSIKKKKWTFSSPDVSVAVWCITDGPHVAFYIKFNCASLEVIFVNLPMFFRYSKRKNVLEFVHPFTPPWIDAINRLNVYVIHTCGAIQQYNQDFQKNIVIW